ncbi:MAG: endolytic transglycosylase MltG [Micrococcales bacterium]|uniref:endolytic transglycosylase MltG n=1 Tax=Phycicoccus sp. TaxID=1902410 RepID=UPI0019BDC0B7|nr:endolytic transglycosylase MltG [Phycicoccus sp.]MBD3784219.1 endolytic transglycosylase MltG [Micrococcales bacterium]HMM96045.1 endolytic transglycosylase MltG [Phycicoccus sp.]
MSQDFTETIFGDDTHHRRPRTRREMHSRRRKPRKGRRFLAVLLAVALVGGAGYGAWKVLGPTVSGLFGGQSATDVDFAGPGSGEVDIVVKQGDTGEAIATTLRDAGVTKTRTAYLDAAKADPTSAAKIQPGTYVMLKGMTGADAFAILVDPNNRVAQRVTLREGLWKNEVFAQLSKATGVKVADYTAAAKDAKAIGLPAAAKGNVEGWLFPASYEFDDKTSATDQLKQMVALTVKTLQDAGVDEKDWERTLTIASIVEGEVSGDADRGKVARVVLNRLEGGPPSYGLLQMDSTVHYAAQQRGKAGTTDAQRNSDSPYNTYKVQGLPPGPIGNPGKASIVAAAKPTPGNWVFFVTVDPSTGETKFASTLAEHDRYVQEFQQWCSDNPGKC